MPHTQPNVLQQSAICKNGSLYHFLAAESKTDRHPGVFDEDCIFEDPTIKFQGTKLYSRNLNLLVPFFDCPLIGLQDIEKGVNSETYFVLARWKLRTYLKFPWRPLISIDGSTVYELDNKLKIIRHAESWNVSALEAIGQIFTPSFDRPGE